MSAERAQSPATVGLLYPGEMGSAFARLLTARGVPVVTTLQGRGERTAKHCREACVVVLPALTDVIRASNVIVSLVTTSAAEEVADDYCGLAHLAPTSPIYVEANSIGPERACRLAQKIEAAGASFVDAAINGLAKNLSTSGTLFLSGARAAEVSNLVGGAMRVRLLGDEPGRASAMKMLLGGMSKGLCALFLELAAMAEHRDMLPEMLEACATIYPGIMTVIDRMLPTYARHAGRRAVEMRELEQTVRATGMSPGIVEAIRALHESLANVEFRPKDGADVSSLVHRAVAEIFPAEAQASVLSDSSTA